ncbi:MAG: choloylglycine hydrolase [Clostridia bacterium]|nr:choloylglycine hydrolase [Clostridia bacterium]
MCTAVTYQSESHYFGRNLDYECSYGESVTVTPRNFPFIFKKMERVHSHYAMIGMAHISGGYPLYYDATNEKGLSMAGLNFPDNAVYHPMVEGKKNLAPYELMVWLLGNCATVEEVKTELKDVNVVKISFSEELPLTPLHWMIADKKEVITVETTKDGLQVYSNPVGVLTNNPPFPEQMFSLNQYPYLTNREANDKFCEQIPVSQYSRGLGGLGLPGDLSSQSRFVRGAFCKLYAVSEKEELASVHQFFHILGSVEQQRGCVCLDKGVYELTIYSSCCNTDLGIYYYTGYENRQITAVDMHRVNLDGEHLVSYPFRKQGQIHWQN